jgi:hypothetical protein
MKKRIQNQLTKTKPQQTDTPKHNNQNPTRKKLSNPSKQSKNKFKKKPNLQKTIQ